MGIKEIALKICRRMNPYSDLHESEFIYFANKLIESYKAELLKEVGEPIYQVCKSDAISLSSAWIDVTEQTYNDVGLYPEYKRRILYTSDQVAAAVAKATKPLEEEIKRLETNCATQIKQRDELLAMLESIKSNLMHHRRFGTDTLQAWKNATVNAERDAEETIAIVKGEQ